MREDSERSVGLGLPENVVLDVFVEVGGLSSHCFSSDTFSEI